MKFPNLLYVADVAVESTVGGELLMHRLLSRYPKDRLTIAESNLCRSDPSERLSGVTYTTFDIAYTRLLRTRLTRWYGSWLHLKARWIPAALKNLVSDVQPDAILTVWHRYSWLTAGILACRHNLPLHLIVHDDAPIVKRRAHAALRPLYKRDFRSVYRQAASRLCVSPYMEEAYRERYGASGRTLYPSRGWDAPSFEHPPSDLAQEKEEIVVGYAGTLHTPGFKQALRGVAEILRPYGGRLVIYSPVSPETSRQEGWTVPNMELRSLIPPEDVIPTLRSAADALFLPTPFEGWARKKNQTNFPSKLTEYTATGLPILMWGPDDASAVRWAQDNPGVAAVVTSPNREDLRPVLQRVATDASYREELGRNALEVGTKYFAAERAWETFRDAILQVSPENRVTASAE
ncbi:hypothetical protein GGQ03_003158 [Salinibacter ruber]|nr:hypothetical protein [Salinibacter ruber]